MDLLLFFSVTNGKLPVNSFALSNTLTSANFAMIRTSAIVNNSGISTQSNSFWKMPAFPLLFYVRYLFCLFSLFHQIITYFLFCGTSTSTIHRAESLPAVPFQCDDVHDLFLSSFQTFELQASSPTVYSRTNSFSNELA